MRIMKRILPNISLILLLAVMVSLALPIEISARANKGSKEYWLMKYGQIKEGDLWCRAQEVFNNVLLSADKRTGIEPCLYIIDFDGLPWALSLADGAIILTKNGLTFCYHDKDLDRGDARLAFVLGHELAHQFNADFWPYHFFRSLEDEGEAALEFEGIKKLIFFDLSKLPITI